MARRLGLDIGDVLSVRWDDDESLEPWQSADEGAYAFCLIYAANYGSDNLFVISRTNAGIKYNKSGKPLRIQRFIDEFGLEDIGVPPDNIRICTEKWDKGPIATEFQLTDYVDNHPICLNSVGCEGGDIRLFHYDNSGRKLKLRYDDRWFYVIGLCHTSLTEMSMQQRCLLCSYQICCVTQHCLLCN